jgi:hypothetical protein
LISGNSRGQCDQVHYRGFDGRARDQIEVRQRQHSRDSSL